MIDRLMRWCVPDDALRSTYNLGPFEAMASVLMAEIGRSVRRAVERQIWGDVYPDKG